MCEESLGAAYFAAIYERNDDPWGFATSPYERAKYDATMGPRAALISTAVGLTCESVSALIR